MIFFQGTLSKKGFILSIKFNTFLFDVFFFLVIKKHYLGVFVTFEIYSHKYVIKMSNFTKISAFLLE